ncbi:MAG TPA: hypothetical protein P5538_06000 [Bacteroidales bacterium]|jgi:hypothetical protein|nr:hypothetical protein [Flavobacterium piscis]HOK37979.1 hypothetical protein [Bacteroidales bacterium]HOL98018.1 hypothetical protein [Bacteroidales bacterium]HOM36553.1 hypothetical protein [Bacteroidales bacterium]HPD23706.1 hypothetical protein [Bacteroidales bacterium]
MERFEKVIIQKKASLQKNSFVERDSDIYVTENELFIEFKNTYFKPFSFINSKIKFKISSARKQSNLLFKDISNFNTLPLMNKTERFKNLKFEIESKDGLKLIFEITNNSDILQILQERLKSNKN